MNRIDDELTKIILDIESSIPQQIERKLQNERFELWSDPALLSNLSGNPGTLFVRAILNKLDIDEHHVLKWRLENKYRQYQILNYYAPDCMAETISFSNVLNSENGIQKIRNICEQGFFIKATLGHGSGLANSFDRTDELYEIIDSHLKEHHDLDKWMLQKRLNLIEECRIHTFGKDLLLGLSFNMKQAGLPINPETEKFVIKILEKLPDTILEGTLIGWDIGITTTYEYYVIETNITGFHSEFLRGFQTSGFFGDLNYGPLICAWLNNYFKNRYQISIGSIEPDLFSSNPFYKEFLFYVSVFENEHFEILRNKTKAQGDYPCAYVREDIDMLLRKLLTYFQIIDFEKYTNRP